MGDSVGDSTGTSSQLNTADMSEADNEEPRYEAGAVMGQQQVVRGRFKDTDTKGNEDANEVQAAAARLARSTETQADMPRAGTATNGTQKVVGRHPHGTTGVSIPWNGGGGAAEYPIDLFDVLEAWIFEYLRDNVHAPFMLSGHFQEYTRFLHIQHRPVTENDFILFRVLGRGGFGAVNGMIRSNRALPGHVLRCSSSPASRVMRALAYPSVAL